MDRLNRRTIIVVAFVLTSLNLDASIGAFGLVGPPSQPKGEQEPPQDLIKIQESLKPLEFIGTKQRDLAPESRVVGVYFDTSNQLNSGLSGFKLFYPVAADSKVNKTKQSQDFEIHQISATTESQESSSPADNVAASTSASTSTTTTAAPLTTSNDLLPAGIEPPNPPPADAPVASKTTRSGAAVFCGEANPNGKSNKRLVLDRIVGGRKTEPGEFPFQVRLNIRSRRGSGICGGVILDERHILTAAHCMTACVSQYLTTATIESTGVHATIGDHSIRSNDGEVEIEIAKITPHEKYDACNFYANDHDIALITTAQPIEYKFTTDGYGSINRPCMPNNTESAVYKENDQVIVSGWGVTRENSGSLSNILRYVQVPVVNITRCQETYGSRVTEDHICAGYQTGGRDSCQGDSGGPLVRVLESRYELVGIVSFGYGCGQPGAPGVYTRVASYIDWIKANL